MGNQWQQKYLLEYNELVSNFLHLKELSAITLRIVLKLTCRGLVGLILIMLISSAFLKTGVIADLILDGIILGNIKQKYWHSLKPLLLILVIVLMFLMMQIQAQEFIKQRVQMCLTKKMKKNAPVGIPAFLQKCDFAGVYGKTLSDYWSKYYDKFKLLLKNYYISSALYLYKNGELDEREYNFSMNALNRSDNISLFFFDIYGYYSSDIL